MPNQFKIISWNKKVRDIYLYMNKEECVMQDDQGEIGKKLLSHIIDRLATNEVEVSDIKQILTVLSKTMTELTKVVEAWDVDIQAELAGEMLDTAPVMSPKTYMVKSTMTEYFRSNSKEAEDIFNKIVYDKNVFVTEVAEA